MRSSSSRRAASCRRYGAAVDAALACMHAWLRRPGAHLARCVAAHQGSKVKVSMSFSGRELRFKDQGKELILVTGADCTLNAPCPPADILEWQAAVRSVRSVEHMPLHPPPPSALWRTWRRWGRSMARSTSRRAPFRSPWRPINDEGPCLSGSRLDEACARQGRFLLQGPESTTQNGPLPRHSSMEGPLWGVQSGLVVLTLTAFCRAT